MANVVKYYFNTEQSILALTPQSPLWTEKAFYYPNDRDYFYQAFNGELKKYGAGTSAGVGIKLNNQVLGGVKSVIQSDEVLDIPTDYEYNIYKLTVLGTINVRGTINIMQ